MTPLETVPSSLEDDWRRHAACVGADTKLFYAPELDVQEHIAATFCSHCPVRVDCLIEAFLLGEEDGVWGGIPEGDKLGGRRWLRKQLARRLNPAQRTDPELLRTVFTPYLAARDRAGAHAVPPGTTSGRASTRGAYLQALPPKRSPTSGSAPGP